jgi:peptidyl-prolyl cis-trans isomerase D
MGLINKIREKSGLAVGIVAIGLGLFVVGGDILSPNSSLLGQNKIIVGEIAGNEITYQEYINEIEEFKYNYSSATGKNPSENEMYTIREQAWLSLIAKYAFTKEFEKLALEVTDEEVVDMVQGKNITAELREMATNPATGEFDREFILNYLQNISNLPPDAQFAWYQFEKNLAPGRRRIKYDNLLEKSSFVTTAEARREHILQNTFAEVVYLYVPYFSVSDDQVSVTDNELRDYMKRNAELFKTTETRSLDFVTFSLVPSAEDTAVYREEIQALSRQLSTAANDSIFARLNSEGLRSFGSYPISEIPTELRELELEVGEVYGPFINPEGYFEVHKLSAISTDERRYARASHILFRANTDEAKREVLQKAGEVLVQLRRGADFETFAREYSDDSSANQGGDLGWFGEDDMVAPFNDAVFAATSKGLIPRLIETEYGYHIINVTELPTNQLYKIATIQIAITPSDETRNEAFRSAGRFIAQSANYDQFKANAQQMNLNVYEAFEVESNDRTVSVLSNAREIVRWLFNDAKVGTVSDVFELDDQYVVAIMTGRTEAGMAPLDVVRAEVTERVKNEKKAEVIKSKLAGLSGNLEEIREAYGPDARTERNASLTFSNNSLGLFGPAPKVIGAAFALQAGQRTPPIAEISGVFMMEVLNRTDAPQLNELSIYVDIIRRRNQGRDAFGVSEAIKDFANIKDFRYKFF